MIFQEDMVQRKGQGFQGFLPDSRLQFAFPYHDGMPSHFSQPVQHLMVPFSVSPDLLHPELCVRFRHHVILASLMSMPEAAVHQNTGAIFPQHDVRLARQPRVIEPIPESPTPQKFPDKNLRFGILALDCRHVIVALFYGHFIWHHLLNFHMWFRCGLKDQKLVLEPLAKALLIMLFQILNLFDR